MRVKFVVPRRRRRKKIRKLAKGYYGAQSRAQKVATQQVLRAWRHSYVGRKLKKRNFRRLWIARINAACRQEGLKYSVFMWALRQMGVELDRKVLAQMVWSNYDDFKKLCEDVKKWIQENAPDKMPKSPQYFTQA